MARKVKKSRHLRTKTKKIYISAAPEEKGVLWSHACHYSDRKQAGLNC